MNDLTNQFSAEDDSPVSVKFAANLFIESLFQFFRQTDLHEPTNQIFDRCLDNIVQVISRLRLFPEFVKIEIYYRGEQIFINDIRLRPKPRQFRFYRYLIRYFRARRLGGISILGELTKEELNTCLWTTANIDPKEEVAYDAARDFLRAQGIKNFELISLKAFHQLEGDDKAALADVELLAVLLHEKIRKFVDLSFSNLERAKDFGVEKVEDYLIDLCTLPEEDLLQVFRLNLSKKHDRYLSYFAVDVAFALIAWGRSLGLPSGVLVELAGAALAHPLLFVLRDQVESSPLDLKESVQLYQMLSRLEEHWKLSDLQKLVLMEWCFPHGNEGVYVWDGTKCYAHFFSRMLRIVSSFKQLTHFLPGRSPLLPDEAMTRMLTSKGDFDPSLLKLFVNWMGIYPVGTLVLLQSGELAQVFAAGSDPLRFQRPVVSILRDSNGNFLDRPELLDLTEMNEKLGIYRKSIKKSISPDEAKLPPEILKMAPVGF